MYLSELIFIVDLYTIFDLKFYIKRMFACMELIWITGQFL